MIAFLADTDDIEVQSDVPPEGDSGVTRFVRESKKETHRSKGRLAKDT